MVAELNDIRDKAIAVFGTAEAAAVWLSNPQASLRGRIPLEVAGSPSGAEEVRRVLELIDFGDYI